MTKKPTIRTIVYFAMLASATAQYQGWQHLGSLCVLTTQEGANLPATASEENFPMLVRLNKDWFDFSQPMWIGVEYGNYFFGGFKGNTP